MLKHLDLEITEKAVKYLEEECEKKIKQITWEQIKECIYCSEINYCEDNGLIFHDDDADRICEIGDRKPFLRIKELDAYAFDMGQELISSKNLKDTYLFFDYYVSSIWGDYQEDLFKAKCDIGWYDEDNLLYEQFQKQIEEITEEELGENKIELFGKMGIGICLEDALYKDEDFKCDSFKEVGYYSGKEIFEINDRLYFIDYAIYDYGCYTYYLQEVGKACYSYFKR